LKSVLPSENKKMIAQLKIEIHKENHFLVTCPSCIRQESAVTESPQYSETNSSLETDNGFVTVAEPQIMSAGQGATMTRNAIKSRKPLRLSSASEAKANPRKSPVTRVAGLEIPYPATSTQVVYVHELSRAAAHVSEEYLQARLIIHTIKLMRRKTFLR
jgi:hypothetical protein